MIDPREVDKVPDEEWEEFKKRALKDELFYNGPGDLLDTWSSTPRGRNSAAAMSRPERRRYPCRITDKVGNLSSRSL